jgi:hypothetical protein
MKISVVIPVFRDFSFASETLWAVKKCDLPVDCELEIIVIDDASGDGTSERLKSAFHGSITLLENPDNRGRAASRNRGARTASGELLLFLDCDCAPSNTTFVEHHLRALKQGATCSCGPAIGAGYGFWHRYQMRAIEKRQRLEKSEVAACFTSANFMISKQSFLRAGEFDERYSAYGFEDRDFALRLLATRASIQFNELAMTIHLDRLKINTVCKKMETAGRTTAILFSQDHPDAYRALGYAAIDARINPALTVVSRSLEPMRKASLQTAAVWLECYWIPFPVRFAFVRAMTALSFLRGTVGSK